MVRENALDVGDLIYPVFIDETATERKPVGCMPGVERLPLDALEAETDEIAGLGIPAVILFGIPGEKDETGDIAYASGNSSRSGETSSGGTATCWSLLTFACASTRRTATAGLSRTIRSIMMRRSISSLRRRSTTPEPAPTSSLLRA
jgi:hypothetical protein